MRRRFIPCLVAAISIVGVTSCSFAPVETPGEKVRALSLAEVESCRKLGVTKVSVLPTLAGIKRPPETVAKELENLARNSAGQMGGDTVVVQTPIVEGERTFAVYKCIAPNQ